MYKPGYHVQSLAQKTSTLRVRVRVGGLELGSGLWLGLELWLG
jgi:hypothetical protein